MKFGMNTLKAALVITAAAALMACGGSGTAFPTASSNAAVATTAANGAAATSGIRNVALSFPGAVPALGTTAATTLTFTDATATPGFKITSGTTVVSGVTTFGSCIFTVTATNDATNFPIGKVITVNPCTVTANTAGLSLSGSPQSVPTTITLGTTTSSSVPVTTTIAADGTLTVGGVTVKVTPSTGGN